MKLKKKLFWTSFLENYDTLAGDVLNDGFHLKEEKNNQMNTAIIWIGENKNDLSDKA